MNGSLPPPVSDLPAQCAPPTGRDRPSVGESVAAAITGVVGSLPWVGEILERVSSFNLGEVTELLERAAYFPMVLSTRMCGDRGSGRAAVAGAPRRFAIVTEQAAGGRIVARNLAGAPSARLEFGWRILPDGHQGEPAARPRRRVALDAGAAQRFELTDLMLRFDDAAGSGLRAYGTGSTLPGSGHGPSGLGLAAVADVLDGWGRLAGLAGTVVLTGDADPAGELALQVTVRMMDPAGGLVSPASVPPPASGPEPEPGVTYLTFLGQIDPENPVTLRLSLTEGVLGSNVYEDLRVAALDFDVATGGRLRSRTATGPIVGTVQARLDFDPLSLEPITPVRTHRGVFDFHDAAGRRLGSLFADMTEGRSFRTRLAGLLLPVFRFAGFGPVCGGTGEFAGARGIMTLNAAIAVQPRTLSNLYTLRLEDPGGRYRALWGGGRR